MIPLYPNTPTLTQHQPPATHYLLAANGLFLVQDTPLFLATTRIPRGHDLEPAAPSLQLRIPRVPRQVLEAAYGFFLELFRRHAGEGFAFLLYSPNHAAFSLAVPPQRLTYREVSGRGTRLALGVQYEAIDRPPDSLVLGDIHSHGYHRAFFSATDNHDDLTRNGLHLVMGSLQHPLPDICASFVTNGTRFTLNPSEVLEPFTTPIAPPAAWLDRVTIESVASIPRRWTGALPPIGGRRP